jgi:hypothetical protein
VTANVVRAIPNDACAPLTNAAAIAGNIAFVDRGGACAAGFSTKGANAAAAGAVGVIIANVSTSASREIAPNMGATDPPCPAQPAPSFGGCTSPALSLGFTDGEHFRAALLAGTVNARMKRDPVILRDGSFDGHVVSHEWGHYISNRLIHNSAGLGNQQGGGMGEGWGDFVALLTTVREEDKDHPANANWSGAFPLVPYAAVAFSGDPYYFGIRRVPYSTDMSKDPLTFKHIGTPIVFGGPINQNASPPVRGPQHGRNLVHDALGVLRLAPEQPPVYRRSHAHDELHRRGDEDHPGEPDLHGGSGRRARRGVCGRPGRPRSVLRGLRQAWTRHHGRFAGSFRRHQLGRGRELRVRELHGLPERGSHRSDRLL